MDRVYTPQEAADYLKIHVNTIYKLLRNGTIPAGRFGTEWRIAEDVLVDYLHGRLGEPRDGGAESEKGK